MARRSSRELRMAEILGIGQEWAPVGELDIWTVASVHRRDCKVVLTNAAGARRPVGFEDLAKYWEPHDHTLMVEAA